MSAERFLLPVWNNDTNDLWSVCKINLWNLPSLSSNLRVYIWGVCIWEAWLLSPPTVVAHCTRWPEYPRFVSVSQYPRHLMWCYFHGVESRYWILTIFTFMNDFWGNQSRSRPSGRLVYRYRLQIPSIACQSPVLLLLESQKPQPE